MMKKQICGRGLRFWFLAAAVLMLSSSAGQRAEASSLINPVSAPLAKTPGGVIEARFHGGGGHGGGGRFQAFHGGGHRHGGFHRSAGFRYGGYPYAYRHHFHRRYYAAPAYYYYPHRHCRVIWTYYGPRRICRSRPWYHHRWHHRWHHHGYRFRVW